MAGELNDYTLLYAFRDQEIVLLLSYVNWPRSRPSAKWRIISLTSLDLVWGYPQTDVTKI